MAESIQVSFVIEFETDGNSVVEVIDADMKQQTRGHVEALGRQYDTTTVTAGVMTSSLSGTESI